MSDSSRSVCPGLGANVEPADRMAKALGLLLEARQYAVQLAHQEWDFAVEIRHLRAAGLTDSDLRWLAAKGFVEHAREISLPSDESREFRGVGRLILTKRSCFILSPSGAAWVQDHGQSGVEGLMDGDKLHPVQQAFVDNDAQQCGFCTPGFVVACKAFLDKQPHPTPEQLNTGLAGNLCRCGTYVGVRAAVMQVAKGGQSNG